MPDDPAQFRADEHFAYLSAELRKRDATIAELVEVLEFVLNAGRGTSGRIIIEGWQEERLRAALRRAQGAER